MATEANDYLFDNEAKQAGHRFGALASLFDPVTVRHLDEVGISAGQRCWEVGAGGGTVARWMADNRGLAIESDIDRYLQRLDDGTLRLTSPTLVSAWGRRPPA